MDVKVVDSLVMEIVIGTDLKKKEDADLVASKAGRAHYAYSTSTKSRRVS